MRITLFCALSASLLISACSRDETPPPAATTAPPAPAAAPADAPPAPERIFSEPELEQMVAPIALYPDPLLAQVLMGATYPGDVADAAAWSAKNPDATGDAAVLQVANQPWDPSVQALVAFPQALAVLAQDPAWVQRLGDAFLAQPEDVMDAVQRLRRKAQDAGNLASNEYQNVSTQPAAPAPVDSAPVAAGAPAPAQETVIIIEPSQPETVYVPSYNPTVVYGGWGYPSYPPPYYPTPYYYPGAALATGMMWGAGIAIGASLWGDMDWGGGDIDIDVNSYNNINRNNQINGGDRSWNHNAANRDGVPYRDKANRERNGRQLDGASNRDAFRGEDARRTQQRNQARSSMQDRGIKPATSNRDARDQARTAGSRDAARDRAGATADRSAQRDRAQQTQRDRQQSADRSRTANQGGRDGSRNTAQQQQRSRQQTQNNTRSRDSARQQQQRQQAPRNNAFEGANRPSSSHQAQQRGRSSHQSASRQSGGRSSGGRSGQPVSRQSSSPQRSSGGGRRR